MDFKKKYIIRCVLSLLALEEQPPQLTESDKLQELIDTNSVNSLLILYKPGKKLKVIYPEENFPLDPNILMVTIIKMSQDIDISSVSDGFNISLSTADCIRNFSNDISRFYLNAASENSNLFDLLKSFSSSEELTMDLDENELTYVEDQFKYWHNMKAMATGPDSKRKAEYFIGCYAQIEEKWKEIETIEQKQFKELIDMTFYALENVWNGDQYPYPPKRFAKLMKAFTDALWKRMCIMIPKVSTQFKQNFSFIELVMKLWINTFEEYRTLNWQNKHFPFTQRLGSYIDKIQDVKKILNLFEEIAIINEKINLELDIKEIQELFEDSVPLSMNPILNRNWEKSKKKFYSVLQSKSVLFSLFFKQKIVSVSMAKTKPLKVLQNLTKWNGLLELPEMKKALQNQKSEIFKIMTHHVDYMKRQFESRTGQSFDPIPGKQAMIKVKNFSPFLGAIVWGRQIHDKIKRVSNYSDVLFKDQQDYQTFKFQVEETLKEIQKFEGQQIEKWKDDLTDAEYSDDGLGIQMNGKMMDLDLENSILSVNYSDKLITLIRDVRQLSQLGLKKQIPEDIIGIADNGRKYYKEALALKKIANFYNNMSEEIIYSQRGMLLRQLQNFEESVESVNKNMGGNKSITWDNPEYVQSYIKNLNDAATILIKQNNRLRKLHFQIMEMIQELINYDLKKQRQAWLLKLQQIKSCIELACRNKEPKYCKKWKVHCDIQLYKILQLQFLNGLEDSESVSEINVDVILKNKEIMFKPSLEDLKDKYYREIMNYLLWPSRVFKGINGNLEVYQKIGEKNSLSVKNMISKAENIFGMLSLHLKSLDQWGAIPYLSVKNIHQKIKTMQEWQFNIRVIRMKRKQLQKLSDYQKLQSFNINQTKLKHLADEFLVQFLEQMMNSLKQSVIMESEEIKVFLSDSLMKLSTKPSSLEEMQQTKDAYLEIKGKQKQTKRKIDEIIMKKKWILQATGYNHETDEMESQWEEFSQKILDYDNLLAEQIEHLKGMIDGRISQLNQEILKYQSKTSSILIPTKREEIPELIELLKEKKKQEEEITNKIKQLRNDCEQFQLPIPNIAVKTIEWQIWDILLQYHQSLEKYENEHFVKMKTQKFYEFQDHCTSWHEKVKKMEKTRQVIHIIKEIDLFKSVFTILRTLSAGILERDHWREFWTVIKSDKQYPIDTLKLGIMLNFSKNISENLTKIQDIVSRAQGEATLIQALKQLAVWWQTAQFQLTLYEGKKSKCHLIRQWKQMTSKVSDNMCLVSSLKQSRWVGKFLQTIQVYEGKIGKVQRALYSLNSIQRRWVYLEPILVGGALPDQLQRFNKLDTAFRNIMGIIAEKPKLSTVADIEGLDTTLDTIQEQQQKCQKALNQFLQVKRSKFPRFYFLGDEDLLQILAQTQNPTVIQLHMKKLFAAIHSVSFTADNKQIIEIASIQKEKVPLTKRVELTENVEDWLNILEKNMFATLEQSLKDYIASGTKQIKLTEYPSQILCLMQQIRFSDQLQSAIQSKNLKGLESQLKQDLQNLTKILPTVGRLDSLKLKAIILDLIHHLNILSLLQKQQKAPTLTSYNYKKNFKFTAKPQMHLFEYKYNYTFQYQGNLPKLVHTPLTDKCYITLALALSLGLGGNPYGPAGTGKTQTVKAMAMLFGRMCLVFNCDEGLDYKSMARIFLGLVRCGAWGCFDEFNRLLEEQLSAISQQIQVIQFAIKANQSHLQLIGKKVEVNPNSGIFVTLNPAGKGYGGRSRLPDNLKQLFRPVAMSVPDNELIAEVLLYSEGFKQAKQLAQKVICLFTLSKQLLSQQQHYDWGLRALKTILSVAGRLIFQHRSSDKSSQIKFQTQCELLIKAIRINTLSKLTFTDMRKFKFLLHDIFPGIESKDIIYEQIQKNVKSALEEMKLSYNEAQVSKVLQFYEATQQRMGVVLVGPSGCGKTTIWKILKRCFQKMGIPLKTYLMNPKSMPRQQLLGQMNNDTREFNEGVLTVSARQVVKNTDKNWIILDGDIDPEWIQSLNSVLDDNHLLTLPTGERINFPNGTCFIFETDSLVYASPATVSRMGMIFLNNEDINIQGVIQKWTDNQPHLKQMFKTLDIQSVLGYDEHVQSTLIGQVNQILSQMKGVETQAQFIAACVRGLTANHLNDPANIINHVFDKFSQRNPFNGKQALCFYAQGKVFRNFSTLPSEFDLYEILSEKGAVLQTSTIQTYLSVLRKWVDTNQHFIVTGPQGCGKGVLIKEAFAQIRKTMKINFATIFCNSQTNAQHIIQKLYQICLKANSGAGKLLKPKDCARLVLYLKDINLPKPDKYQTIQLASFLQQIISHKGFYDPQSLEFVLLDEKIQIVVSMFPPSSIGRNQLTQRFTAIVKILSIDYPSNQDLVLIYTEYFKSLLRDRKMDESLGKILASFFIEVYLGIKKNFSVDQYRHYSFTPKSLFEIFRNLPKYQFNDQQGLIQAISNQFFKNYRNKVVSSEAKKKFEQLYIGFVRNHFRFNPINNQNIMTFISGRYIKIKREDYDNLLKTALVQYQRQYKEIMYVSMDQSINHISSIEKVLVSNGNIMLVGCSGSGRRTALLLAALMQKIEVGTLNTIRDFTARQFKKQIKSIIENVVNENKKQVLFLEDHNLAKPEFIQMVNSLIISGEIPGLFTLDELQRLPVAEQLRKDSLGKSLHEAFCDKVIQNLKIVLSLDHLKEGFFEMCASNPALYACNIIWFDNLPSNALRNIGAQYLSRYLPEFSKATVDQIVGLCSETHKVIEQKYNSHQRSFYNLIDTYVNIYSEKNKSKKTQAMHLQKGLQKLQEAKQLVDVLSKEAYEKQKLLEVKNAEASRAMSEIQKAMTEAGQRKREAEDLSRNLQGQQKKILTKKQSVQEQLADVQPLIDQAKKSVSSINSRNLNQLASLGKPPQPIVDVMKVLLRMFGESNADWNTIKTYLKNRSFIDNVLNFDPRMINQDIRRDVEKQIEKNSNSFQKDVIYRASVAAGPLADWVKATLKYSRVVQSIKPLEGQLNKLLKELDVSKSRVIQCEEQIAKIEEKGKELKKIYDQKIGEAVVLDNQLKKSQETLTTAKNLLEKLEDQRVRWQADFNNIQKEVQQYPISSFIAAAFVTYLSDKDEHQREVLVSQWSNRTKIPTFNFLKFMINESIQLKWRSFGLSSDSLSVQNSTMIFFTSKVPLIMDPNNQAIQWLKKQKDKMDVINQRNPKFTNTLQLAVRFGKELLIQQIDEIQAILIPIIRKDTFQQGSRVVIRVGDKVIDYSQGFKLYLSTRNTNMHLPSNTQALVCLINYSVTRSGLQSKLLSMVINHQKPQLQHKKSQLLENQEKLKTSLTKLEEQLLEELGSSSGNILQNKALLDNLTKTKVESTNISQSLRESQELNVKLDRERDIFKSLAKKGAQIYLLISQLHKINNMYRFSLAYFSHLFLSCLSSKEQMKLNLQEKSNSNHKLKNAEEILNKIVFNNIASSLFKVDRLSFGLYLMKGVNPDLISERQWQFFTGVFPIPLQNKFILPTWANFERQQAFNHFCTALPKITKTVNFNDSQFQTWYLSEDPQKSYPTPCKKLTPFQRILLIMVFRPERLQTALIQFTVQGLGVNSISGQSQSFKSMCEKQVNNTIPALFIVSTGYDPSKQLQEFAESEIGHSNYIQLSMGGGQNQAALELMKNAAEKGQWLCLKNIHLVTSWLPILQKQFRAIENKHDRFKLFLTSQQHLAFPNVLLETCFKVSYESPPGMKKNFVRIYQQLEASGNPLKANFIFLLAFFHSLVQQRRNYIPQGWSKSYEFSYSDLKVSMEIISNLVKEYEQTNNLNLQTLYGIFEEGIYGGRIDNPSDLKVLRAYLRKYFNLLVINGQAQVAIDSNIPKNQKQLANFIAKLPDIDDPSMFGLPKNIDRVVQRNNSMGTIAALKKLTSIMSSGGDLKKQQWYKILSPLFKSWQQIYKQIKDAKIPPVKQAQLLAENPVESFIYLEMSQALQLLEKINKNMKSMENILQGRQLMNTEIQKLLNKLIENTLPKQWEDFYSECQEPLEWVRKFGRRVILLKQWIIKANNQRLNEEEFDLSELFHPGVFLNACKQAAARNKIALDKLSLVATFEQNKASENAVRLKGLLLQGCSMNKHLLGATTTIGQQFQTLPTLYIDFLSNPPPMYPNIEQFCLFSSSTRESMLMKLNLGITGNSSDKIIAGTAILLKDI